MDEENVELLLRGFKRVERGVLRPTHERVEMRLDRAGKFEATAEIQGVTTEARAEIPFLLHPGFTVHELKVNGTPVSPSQDGPILYWAPPVARGPGCGLRVRYSGEYTMGSHRTPAGDRWYEFNMATLWRPLFSLDLCQGVGSRVSASLPGRLHVVSSIAKTAICSADEETVCQWDTGANPSLDFMFVAGEGEYAESRSGMPFAALTMRGAPYRPEDVIALAKEIVELYVSLWGECPFGELAIACPPESIAGNCAGEGLVIAGLIRDDLAWGFGVLAHEISHQWWGLGIRLDLATRPGCREGLASYAFLVARRKRFGVQALRKTVAEHYLPLAREAEAHGTALLDCTMFQPYSWALREGKGGCAFLLLERALGEEIMSAALRDFAARFRGRAATPDDLHATLVAFGGPDAGHLWARYVAGTEPLPTDIERYVV
jgi:hypothetical protein